MQSDGSFHALQYSLHYALHYALQYALQDALNYAPITHATGPPRDPMGSFIHFIMYFNIHYVMYYNYALQYTSQYALYQLCMLPGPCRTLCITICITICIALCITLYITICSTICILPVMHAIGTLRDPPGPYAVHYALQYVLHYA